MRRNGLWSRLADNSSSVRLLLCTPYFCLCTRSELSLEQRTFFVPGRLNSDHSTSLLLIKYCYLLLNSLQQYLFLFNCPQSECAQMCRKGSRLTRIVTPLLIMAQFNNSIVLKACYFLYSMDYCPRIVYGKIICKFRYIFFKNRN